MTIRGTVDEKTGMVMNITELKDHMDHAVMKPMDHKNLDKDVDFFYSRVSFNYSLVEAIFTKLFQLVLTNSIS